MFAYCRNNPIVLEDATGTADRACIYAEGRINDEPWRDHSPGGGGIPRRNYGSYSNYYGEVADKFYTVKFFRAVGNGLEYLWNAYVHSNELQVQQKYEQDMAVRDHWNDGFSSPGRLRDFIGMSSAIITAYSAYVKLAMASSVAFGPIAGLIVALVPAVISILEYYGVIDISELEWEAFEL